METKARAYNTHFQAIKTLYSPAHLVVKSSHARTTNCETIPKPIDDTMEVLNDAATLATQAAAASSSHSLCYGHQSSLPIP